MESYAPFSDTTEAGACVNLTRERSESIGIQEIIVAPTAVRDDIIDLEPRESATKRTICKG